MGNCVSANASASKSAAAGGKKNGGAPPIPEPAGAAKAPVARRLNKKDGGENALESHREAKPQPAARTEEPAEIKVEDANGGKVEKQAVENPNPAVN